MGAIDGSTWLAGWLAGQYANIHDIVCRWWLLWTTTHQATAGWVVEDRGGHREQQQQHYMHMPTHKQQWHREICTRRRSLVKSHRTLCEILQYKRTRSQAIEPEQRGRRRRGFIKLQELQGLSMVVVVCRMKKKFTVWWVGFFSPVGASAAAEYYKCLPLISWIESCDPCQCAR